MIRTHAHEKKKKKMRTLFIVFSSHGSPAWGDSFGRWMGTGVELEGRRGGGGGYCFPS